MLVPALCSFTGSQLRICGGARLIKVERFLLLEHWHINWSDRSSYDPDIYYIVRLLAIPDNHLRHINIQMLSIKRFVPQLSAAGSKLAPAAALSTFLSTWNPNCAYLNTVQQLLPAITKSRLKTVNTCVKNKKKYKNAKRLRLTSENIDTAKHETASVIDNCQATQTTTTATVVSGARGEAKPVLARNATALLGATTNAT